MKNNNFDELLLSAEKPSRYIGAEVNAVHKNNAEVRFLLLALMAVSPAGGPGVIRVSVHKML